MPCSPGSRGERRGAIGRAAGRPGPAADGRSPQRRRKPQAARLVAPLGADPLPCRTRRLRCASRSPGCAAPIGGTSIPVDVVDAEGWAISIAGEQGPALVVRSLVNSAGLAATQVASMVGGLGAEHAPEPVYARGCYFSYARPADPLPAPDLPGAGAWRAEYASDPRPGRPRPVRAERLMAGGTASRPARLAVCQSLHPEFLAAARRIWEGVEADALQPDYAGIGPKVRTASGIAEDFLLSGPAAPGLPGLVNLFGIESPGLTASLALGDEVAEMVAAD